MWGCACPSDQTGSILCDPVLCGDRRQEHLCGCSLGSCSARAFFSHLVGCLGKGMGAGPRPLESCCALAAPFEFLLAGLLAKANCTKLLELVWRRNSATTMKRYLQSLFRVFDDGEFGGSFSLFFRFSCTLFLLYTVPLTAASPLAIMCSRLCAGLRRRSSSTCLACTVVSLLLQLYFSERVRNARHRRFRLHLLCGWSFLLLRASRTCPERMFVGAVLICLWPSLRFGDAQHVRWSSLLFDLASLRGWCYKTKTHPRGTPFAITSGGFCGYRAGNDWLP